MRPFEGKAVTFCIKIWTTVYIPHIDRLKSAAVENGQKQAMLLYQGQTEIVQYVLLTSSEGPYVNLAFAFSPKVKRRQQHDNSRVTSKVTESVHPSKFIFKAAGGGDFLISLTERCRGWRGTAKPAHPNLPTKDLCTIFLLRGEGK